MYVLQMTIIISSAAYKKNKWQKCTNIQSVSEINNLFSFINLPLH